MDILLHDFISRSTIISDTKFFFGSIGSQGFVISLVNVAQGCATRRPERSWQKNEEISYVSIEMLDSIVLKALV